MSLAEAIDRAKNLHGALIIGFDSEDPIGWRVRVSSWPFVFGRGAGYTLGQACQRAVKQYDRHYAAVEFASLEEPKAL